MQTVNLTSIIDPENSAQCVVTVPDGYALAEVPKGRGSLACWLARLPDGSTMVGQHPATHLLVRLAKLDGRFVDLDEAERDALIERRWRAVA